MLKRIALFACVLAAAVTANRASAQQLGSISFPNSGKAEAQDSFLRGVLLLHNFAYPQAAAAFIEAQQADPDFALAYWGEAMTYHHPIWYETDNAAAKRALAKFAGTAPTARERAYMQAVATLFAADGGTDAYQSAMERLARAYPEDVEAQVFWALSILGTRARDEIGARKQIRAAAILEPLFATRPDHPGVLHYLIHAYDDPIHAPLGLRAARRYSTVASGAPHALHMPSHIFLQLGMWPEAARSNEAAYMLSLEWVAKEKASSEKRDLHSLAWLQYVYLQQKRYDDAKRLLNEVRAKLNEGPHEHQARDNMQARYAIETGDWSVLDELDPHSSVQFALGMKAALRKEYAEAQRVIGTLRAASGSIHNENRNVVEVQKQQLQALLYAIRGETTEALRVLQLAIEAEDKLGEPSGPPLTIKPSRELYGELLLRAGRKEEAAEAFRQVLLVMPGRAVTLAGLARATQ